MLENIKKLTAISGVSGDEGRVASEILEQIQGHCKAYVDSLGNIIAFKKGKKTPKNSILLTAHMDEVGFIVTYIEENGMLRFAPVGGIDSRLTAGKRLYIGEKMLPASVGIKAIHQQKAEEKSKAPDYDALYLDIGASTREEAEAHVKLGDRAAFEHNHCAMGDSLLRCKALDNRAGCAMLIKLLTEDCEYDINCAFTVQEETGCNGAKTVGNIIQSDISIIVETTTAGDIAGASGKEIVCELGKGPVISFMDRGTIYSTELFELAKNVAQKEGIPYQIKAAVTGANESKSLQVAGAGCKTLVISAACRYLHSPATVLAKADLLSMYKLIQATADEAAML